MKFGKQIQAKQIPGWSAYYLDYKFLKKIISSLAANRPASEAAALALGIRPLSSPSSASPSSSGFSPSPSPLNPQIVAAAAQRRLEDDEEPGCPPIFSASEQDDDRGADFQAHKAAFFFKLERELEKINAFYLQKEAELKLRLETLLSKRRAAATRVFPDNVNDFTQTHVEWSAVEEGFRLLERDLGKLEQFIEINAVGFRKILKKWDKRSKSTTKELYLARQVDVQPVFNRQLISELSDTVAACLLDLTDISTGLSFEGSTVNDIYTQQIISERIAHAGPFRDLENNFRRALVGSDKVSLRELIHYSDVLSQENGGKSNVTRILWKIIIEAPQDLADLMFSSLATPFDFLFIDDINGRTCLHEAAIAGALRLVDICLKKGVQSDKVDVYGRSALHYASMNGHADVCRRLLEAKVPLNILDMDNYSPLVYATLTGNLDCVKVLLGEDSVAKQLTAPSGDLIPLSLASQAGHKDVVLLLLQRGAKSVPNSNGEYPIHLAAREGHVDVCKLLIHHAGWDTPDKYNEWTPLFHAARYGHEPCIKVLLEAGSRVHFIDELGHLAVHYAAWYGHHRCATLLLDNSINVAVDKDTHASPQNVPIKDVERAQEFDVDLIPSLSLPPPIMPHRVYGHNYLDKSCLVQVCISPVHLHPRLLSPLAKDQYLLCSSHLKLVMTSPDVNSTPYTISLPQKDQEETFTFQIPSHDALSLEFSIYPNFGTKTIGRAIALPSLFKGVENSQSFVLPILDNRLHIIGEVPFQINVVTPFSGVTLEIGGAVETYWKSMASPLSVFGLQPALSRLPQLSGSIASTHTSPSNHSIMTSASHALTISSLSGNYVYLVVQVTQDLQPVVYPEWLLPETGFDLGVADVTLAQFEALAERLNRKLDITGEPTAQKWYQVISRSMVSLSQLMKILPVGIGVSLDMAYPSSATRQRHSLRHRLDLNDFVDSVLRTIYQTSAWPGVHYARRRLNFMSFCPDICAAFNWKQPNYPVFFASQCGIQSRHVPCSTALGKDDGDRRLSSLGAAVEFSKINNLLGIFLDIDLVEQVPSLVQGIRDGGLLVGIYGVPEKSPSLGTNFIGDGGPIDALIHDGVVVYTDHSMHELV